MKNETQIKLLFTAFIIGMLTFVIVAALSLSAKADDWSYLDSTFRAMEQRTSGGMFDGKCRTFVITKDLQLPKIGKDNKTKTFVIENLTVKGGGLIASATDWNDLHNYQTNRTFILRNINIYSADVGMWIQGSHRSTFATVSFWSCRVGGKFELCLEGYAEQLQEHQCRDTGVYVGISRLAGSTESNSQSNNFRINGFRSYGAGNSIALIYHGVSGGLVTNLTNEGGGCRIFLLVNSNGGRFMKDFRASQFHIECANKESVIKIIGGGYANYYFSDIFPQVGNYLIDAEGSGFTVNVSNLFYQPYNTGWSVPYIKFAHKSAPNGDIWWNIVDCVTLDNIRTYYDPAYWKTGNGYNMPNPFSSGQQTNNRGSNRLREIPYILK